MCSRFQILSESELIQTTRSFGNCMQKIIRLYQCMKLKLLTLLRTSRSLIFEETGWQRWASGYTKSFIVWLRLLTLQLHVLDYSPFSELCYFLTTTSQNPKFPNKSTFKSERLQPKYADPVLLVFDSLILLIVFQKSIYKSLSNGYRKSQVSWLYVTEEPITKTVKHN